MYQKQNFGLSGSVLFTTLFLCATALAQGRSESDTLPVLNDGVAPRNFAEIWAGFDPVAEPLEVENIHEWEEDGVVMRIVRFRIGVFKGQKAKLAAIYGFPKSITSSGEKIPGLVQIHGGGQYADHRACLMNAKRGYATVSLAWAGRISAPEYYVRPAEVKLFWDGKTDATNYKLTTDWGAVDGYHAPCRNPKNSFPSVNPAAWTIDAVESPRNSPWFLCAIAARRALTFMEQQPEVDAERLGVYGHSMGGKLTVMTSVDARVKAAAPSCGGISDRDNVSELYEKTIGDHISLKEISCPIIFLSPANDFHGRIGDLPRAMNEIQSPDWRATCSPHRNHQDSAEYEVATLLWFDQHLKHEFEFPMTPATKLQLKTDDGIPSFTVQPDATREILSVDVFYTQDGKEVELPSDREDTMSRFWRHAVATKSIATKSTAAGTGAKWTANLPLVTVDRPLWVYANVNYALDQPVSGAGYYYRIYTADSVNVSSLLETASADSLRTAGVRPTLESSLTIEDFSDNWRKEWFSNTSETWPRATHKLHDEQYKAPKNVSLAFEVRSAKPNKLVVLIGRHAAVIDITRSNQWREVVLAPNDLQNHAGEPLSNWSEVRRLKLGDIERLQPAPGDEGEARIVGKRWQGADPEFRNLRWVPVAATNE